MLRELGAEGSEGLEMCPCVKALCSEMSAEAAEERPCLRQCVSRVLHCACHSSM